MAKARYGFGMGADTSVGPSASIWAKCPWLAMIEDPNIGYQYWEDYLKPNVDVTDGHGYSIATVTSGSILHTPLLGGGLLVRSAANANANDGPTVFCGAECWKPAVEKTLWFEARVAMDAVELTPDQFLVGLTDSDTAPISSGSHDFSGESHLAFFMDSGTTVTQIEFASVNAGDEDINTDVDGSVVTDAAYVKLGFIVDTNLQGELQVHVFINGEEIRDALVTDPDHVPVTEMVLTYVAQTGTASRDAEMTIDWVRIAQLR